MYDFEDFPTNNNVDRLKRDQKQALLQSHKSQATDINARARVELLENDSIRTDQSMVDQRSGRDNIGNPENAIIHTRKTAERAKKDMQERPDREMQQEAVLSMLGKKKQSWRNTSEVTTIVNYGRTTTIRTVVKKTRERSVNGKPETSAPLIVVIRAVNAFSCPRRFVTGGKIYPHDFVQGKTQTHA
jgi:hypothetical protein